ncbi:hypothetical protein DIPPA_25266 [Diplonema papillatum]|nr:hypothetical protein DIPPA_25266 [Diplonema papillatum]
MPRSSTYGALRPARRGRAAAAHAAGAVGRFAAEALPALMEPACSDVDCSCCVARLLDALRTRAVLILGIVEAAR